MNKRDITMKNSATQYHLMPITVLTLITVLNIGILILFLTAYTGGTTFVLSSMQVYVLAGLELAGVVAAYRAGKRRKTTVPF